MHRIALILILIYDLIATTYTKILGIKVQAIFSVTRCYKSDKSYWLSVLIDFTDVTLVSDDTYRRLYLCDPDYPDGPDDSDESYLVMKVI